MKRSTLGITLVLGASMLAGCAMFQATKRPADDLSIQRTPERVARGAYLSTHVMACMTCHSQLSTETHTPLPGKKGAGGRLFGKADGFPGNMYSTNLTPDRETGLGAWSDGEVLRAMREGVSKDGHALFPLMPYPTYHQMSDEDAQAIVAFLRTLPPVHNPFPARELDFPLNLIVNTIPQPLEKSVQPAPDAKADPVARGRYVFSMASCTECHTPMSAGKPDMSKFMAGGHTFADGGHAFLMPNLTQDRETGIGAWTDKQIEAAVRYGQRPNGGRLNPFMPWPAYNGMSDSDMKSLIAHLRTVPAVKSIAPKN